MLREALPGMRLTPAGNLHVTLKFLGDVPDERVMDVVDAVRQIPTQGAMELELAGLWPATDRPSAVVGLGLTGPGLPRLLDLFEATDETMLHAGFRKEGRAFSPHVTLGRMKPPTRLPGALRDRTNARGGIGTTLDELVLYVSDLGPGGASYTRVSSHPLDGGG